MAKYNLIGTLHYATGFEETVEAETEAAARVEVKRRLEAAWPEIGAVDLQEICINSVDEVEDPP
jgi:hypothetical protein